MDYDANFGVTIYVDHHRTTIKGINLQLALAKFFLTHGVHRNYITIYDIGNNYEKQAEIKNHSKKIPKYPYIGINGKLWGEGCMVDEKAGEIVELIQPLVNAVPDEQKSVVVDAFVNDQQVSEKEITAETSLQLGYTDAAINVTEWLLFGLVKGVVSSTWRANTPPLPELDESDFECEVIRTNWYGRHQFRKYRFTPQEIFRLSDGVVRATLFYKDIKELKQVDKKNIILTIENGEAQYIEGVEKDISKIIEIVTSRSYLAPTGEDSWASTIASQ
ncbi:hypothetical protein PPL_05890 [Heterostelium album PN500]|uniref:Uncharacterized protein n=1 Tax=Heterostelium pallidum (strain ATCC 26659 / Pp 5 / PN500) TaxID=670386 RepID=D3BBM1_HETP5|nr:hypothetical protein PPL_05890 [Heterostelium album PN500]EFA81054.1 hypothetical protein PPL_05890 [Heterostelium album PN500]|eukprot:XP_020433172.1 hypothetical protein PPL_05890 [Heterostelium album PN500]